MQKTTTIKTLLFLLLISLASVSYGQDIATINLRIAQQRAIIEELSGDLDTKVLNVQDYLTRVLP